jgi:hypothetical protein
LCPPNHEGGQSAAKKIQQAMAALEVEARQAAEEERRIEAEKEQQRQAEGAARRDGHEGMSPDGFHGETRSSTVAQIVGFGLRRSKML